MFQLISCRCCTGEAWQLIMLACLSNSDCDPASGLPEKDCGSTAAYAYFTSFVFLSSFLVSMSSSLVSTCLRATFL